MHRVTLDFANAVIELVAEGPVDQNEMTEVFSEMREAAYKLQGRAIKCFIDLRQTTISSPEMAQRIKEHQQAMAKLGMQRVAEVVTSSLLALQERRRVPRRRRARDHRCAARNLPLCRAREVALSPRRRRAGATPDRCFSTHSTASSYVATDVVS
jgi:hypothetical protein